MPFLKDKTQPTKTKPQSLLSLVLSQPKNQGSHWCIKKQTKAAGCDLPQPERKTQHKPTSLLWFFCWVFCFFCCGFVFLFFFAKEGWCMGEQKQLDGSNCFPPAEQGLSRHQCWSLRATDSRVFQKGWGEFSVGCTNSQRSCHQS